MSKGGIIADGLPFDWIESAVHIVCHLTKEAPTKSVALFMQIEDSFRILHTALLV